MLAVVVGVWAALGCATAEARQRDEGRTEAPGDRDEAKKKQHKPRPMSEKVAGRAAEGAIDQTLESLDEPENRERLSGIIASPPMQAAVHDVTTQMVAGIFDGVDVARAKGQLPRLPSNIGRSIGRTIDRDISPAAGRLVHTAVDAAIESALSEGNSARVEALVQRVGASAASGLAVSVRDELGPALAITLERDIVPAIGRGMQSPEVQAAILKTMVSLGIGSVRGTAAGLAETDVNGKSVPSVGGTFALGVLIASIVAGAFGVLFIVMTVLLVRSNRRQRELTEQSRKREERFIAVLEGRMDTHHDPITSPGVSP